MTKSDRKRVLAALARWEARYRATTAEDSRASLSDSLAAAVDWLRAEVKLAGEYVDPEGSEWAHEYLYTATVMVAGIARDLAEEIRAESKTL